MIKIEIKYTQAYVSNGESGLKLQPSLAVGGGLPENLQEASQEYETLCRAMNYFIKKVNSMPDKKVQVQGGLELFVQ